MAMNTEQRGRNIRPWYARRGDGSSLTPARPCYDTPGRRSMRKTTAKKTKSRENSGAGVAVDPAFAPVVAAFARDREVGLGRMFSSSSVLNVNGKIFAMYVKGKFVAKLPRERVSDLVRSGTGELFDPGHGRLMKEWVALAAAKATWVELAREARAFVKTARR